MDEHSEKALDEMSERWIRRLAQIDVPTQNILYHYTKIDSAIGIIQNRELWATHIRYLNDPRELKYGLNLARNIAEGLKSQYTDSNSATFLKAIQTNDDFFHEAEIYLVSLSEKGDLLSQWRGYGDKHRSVCLGFDVQQMKRNSDITPNEMTFLHKVMYDPAMQGQLLREFMIEYINIIQNMQTIDLVNDLSIRLTGFLQLLTRMKDPCWKEESEWRLIFLNQSEVAPEVAYHKRWFRSGERSLTPFIKAHPFLRKYNNSSDNPFAEIVLPKSEGYKDNMLAFGDMLFHSNLDQSMTIIKHSEIDIKY